VLDVFCAYLRRPFTHPSYAQCPANPDQVTSEDSLEADREREVRRTVQRLIRNLLPYGQNPDQRTYHLDLTGASLEYFRLEEGTRIGRLTARQARFYGITRLSEMHISDRALFARATFLGRADLNGTQFVGGISFQETTFHDEVAFKGASVSAFIDLNTTAPERQVGALASQRGPM
jgi:Pentapeptide repeats (9 copies)